uniref:Uncharacterized protein n=1 Tax=Panagrolaimus sp. PS1159 TaxID=55785 RepID=A0AC35GMR4_9BILA
METSGPHSLEIGGFTYIGIGKSTSSPANSECYFKDFNITKIGVIKYFIQKDDGKIVAYIRPLPTRSINDNFEKVETPKDSKSFQYYRILLPTYSQKPVVTHTEYIIRKGFLIDLVDTTFIVPIIHVFDFRHRDLYNF